MNNTHRFALNSTVIFGLVLILITGCKKDETSDKNPPATVTDIDGNVYHTIVIGSQVWMVENLRTTKYRNGDPIPNVKDAFQWVSLISGAYCDYNNNSGNSSNYGKLYNWHAVNDNRKITPLGWHIPTDEEWSILSDFLGNQNIAGGKLKEIGFSHWQSPNTGATNESGFTGLPGGGRGSNGNFSNMEYDGNWWSSTQSTQEYAWSRYLGYSFPNMIREDYDKKTGFSVRCIMD